MNLIIDVGNTFVKFAVFQKDSLVHKVSFKLLEFKKEFDEVVGYLEKLPTKGLLNSK